MSPLLREWTDNQLTISWPVGEEDEAEVRMNDDVPVALLHLAHATAIRECQLSVSSETAEDRHDVFCRLVCLVDGPCPRTRVDVRRGGGTVLLLLAADATELMLPLRERESLTSAASEPIA